MKVLLLTTLVATICYVNAGKTQRLLAALNGGVMPGMNGGLLAGVNGGLMPGMNGGLIAGMNGGMANGGIPGMMAGGLNPAMVAGGTAGLFGQPQFAQFVPGRPVFALPAPVPNVYAVPAVNVLPFTGIPQTPPVNPQQPLVGITGGAMQQQLPVQPDPLKRFRRQTVKQDNTFKATVDTQIPAPTESMTTTPCDGEGRHVDN